MRDPIPPVDPHVADVEAILEAVASRSTNTTQLRKRRPAAAHALWLCACETLDDAPVWLIYDSDDEGLGWCRVPDGAEVAGLVDSRRIAGAHTSPDEVLLAGRRGSRPRRLGRCSRHRSARPQDPRLVNCGGPHANRRDPCAASFRRDQASRICRPKGDSLRRNGAKPQLSEVAGGRVVSRVEDGEPLGAVVRPSLRVSQDGVSPGTLKDARRLIGRVHQQCLIVEWPAEQLLRRHVGVDPTVVEPGQKTPRTLFWGPWPVSHDAIRVCGGSIHQGTRTGTPLRERPTTSPPETLRTPPLPIAPEHRVIRPLMPRSGALRLSAAFKHG